MNKQNIIDDALQSIRELRVKAEMMAEDATKIEKELVRINALGGAAPGHTTGSGLTNAEIAKLTMRSIKQLSKAKQ